MNSSILPLRGVFAAFVSLPLVFGVAIYAADAANEPGTLKEVSTKTPTSPVKKEPLPKTVVPKAPAAPKATTRSTNVEAQEKKLAPASATPKQSSGGAKKTDTGTGAAPKVQAQMETAKKGSTTKQPPTSQPPATDGSSKKKEMTSGTEGVNQADTSKKKN